MRRRIDRASLALGLGVLSAVLLLFYLRPPQVMAVEEAVFDQYQRWQPRAWDPAAPVRVIDIDEESLRRIGQWPWPRTYLAEMVRRLTEAGAAVIAFDMTFAEPDRTSPAVLAATLGRFGQDYGGLFAEIGESAAPLPDHDEIFGRMIARTPVVLGAIATDDPPTGRLPPKPAGIAISGGGDVRAIIEWFRGAIPNLPVLSQGAAGVGTIVLARDEGGIVRRVPLVVGIGDQPNPYPALSIEALRVAQGAPSFILKTSLGSGESDFSGHPAASRLEGQSKTYGVGNLIGARTAAAVPGFALIEIDNLAVKGRAQPETVFTIAGDEAVAATPGYARLAGVIASARSACLAQDWDTAEAAFVEIAGLPPVGTFDPRPFAEVYLGRIARYRLTPPPRDWDGVHIATSK